MSMMKRYFEDQNPEMFGVSRRGSREKAENKNLLLFSDGVGFDLSGEYRVERRKDGYYVVGKGSLIPVESREEGESYILELKGGKRALVS